MDNNDNTQQLKIYRNLYLAIYIFIEIAAAYFAWKEHTPFSSISDCFNFLWTYIAYCVIGILLYVGSYLLINWLDPKPNKAVWAYFIPIPVIVFIVSIINFFI